MFAGVDEVLQAKEIRRRVCDMYPEISENSIAPELKSLSDGGRLERVSYGKYKLPWLNQLFHGWNEGDAGHKSGDSYMAAPKSIRHTPDTLVSYPVYDVGVGAGPGMVREPTEEFLMAPRSIVTGWTGGSLPKRNEAYWTKVRGTSMEPWLPDGSPILVVRCNSVVQGGRYILYLDDDDVEVVKRVEKLGGGVIRIISDNLAHSSQTFRHQEDDVYRDEENGLTARIRVQGVVVYPKDTGYAITKMVTSHR